MLYEEFLRKGGLSQEEVPLKMYAKIEAIYMERDDLFPDQESVIAHFKTLGSYGFAKPFIDAIDGIASTLGHLSRIAPEAAIRPAISLALKSAGIALELKEEA